MVTIALKGMRFHSFHGYYAEEQSVGNNYEIDVTLQTPLDISTLEDDLDQTINYEVIYRICKEVMDRPARLIETVAKNILIAIHDEIDQVTSCKICLRKMNPLLGGLVDHALIEIEG